MRTIKFLKSYWFPIAFMGIGVVALLLPDLSPDSQPKETSLSNVQQLVSNDGVSGAVLYQEDSILEVTTSGGVLYARFLPETGELVIEQLDKNSVPYTIDQSFGGILEDIRETGLDLLPIAIVIGILLLVLLLIVAPLAKMLSRQLAATTVTKTDHSAEVPNERFADVIGADEAVCSLRTLVEFLQNPERFKNVLFERGVLFYGPAGTGKTLLSMAVAGEAGVPFYHLSGSSLASTFKDGTTQGVLELFKRVKKEVASDKPVVVFIDEIDNLAGARQEQNTWADKDHTGTVTALLHEISQLFRSHQYAVLIGATNHRDRLDSAITRSQRLGLHIAMPNPDQKAREAILTLNSKGLTLDPDLNLSHTAKLMNGRSGADLASIPGRASALAVEGSGDGVVRQKHLEQAAMELVFSGKLRHSAEVTPENARVSRAHESGHATLAQASPYHSLMAVTTIPIQESGGSTWFTQDEEWFVTRKSLVWTLAVALGGREAEILELGQATSGSTHDLEQVTELATKAVCSSGLFDGFLLTINPEYWENYPQSSEILRQIQSLIAEARQLTQQTLKEHETFRSKVQAELAERRILHSDELRRIAEECGMPSPAAI